MAGTKEVELWDFELWPDKVLCCTAWTGMGKPYEERTYLPERKARKVTVWTHDTDHATGHTECSECKGSINPCAKWCEHCGCEFEGES